MTAPASLDVEAYQTAERICLDLLGTVFDDRRVQVQTGPAADRTDHTTAALTGQPLRWFVRLIPCESHTCLLILGRPDGAGHEHLTAPIWLGYPSEWTAASEEAYAAKLDTVVTDALRRIDTAQVAAKEADTAGLLPGTGVGVRLPRSRTRAA